jgi:hypothetical protein
MPKYLVKLKGKKLDIVHIPKSLSAPKKAILEHNKNTIFKGYREVDAKSEIHALSKITGVPLRKKR